MNKAIDEARKLMEGQKRIDRTHRNKVLAIHIKMRIRLYADGNEF